MINIAIVSGSHRESGNSHRVVEHICALAEKFKETFQIHPIDISAVPLWDEGKWGNKDLSDKWEFWQPISHALQNCDALIVVSPEYGGMASPMISNFLLLVNSEEVGHKPALLVSVSTGRGGSYPVAQLRAFSSKNNHLCWIPDHVIVRDVESYLKDVNEGKESYTSKMLSYSIRILLDYANALIYVRQKGNVDYKQFPYGM